LHLQINHLENKQLKQNDMKQIKTRTEPINIHGADGIEQIIPIATFKSLTEKGTIHLIRQEDKRWLLVYEEEKYCEVINTFSENMLKVFYETICNLEKKEDKLSNYDILECPRCDKKTKPSKINSSGSVSYYCKKCKRTFTILVNGELKNL